MRSLNIKLWFAFLLISLIPAIQNIIRLHFIGDMPNEWGFNIASQIQWLNIIYEIIKEGLLIPLFYMLSLSHHKNDKNLESNAFVGLFIVFIIHIIISFFIFIFSNDLLDVVNLSPELKELTNQYIKLESIAIIFSVSSEYLIIYLATLGRIKEMIWFSVLKSFLLISSDFFLISTSDYSLNLGINGIAISNIFINIILSCYVLFSSSLLRYALSNKYNLFNIVWIKNWFKIGAFSGLESLIRNAVFFIMILSMMNKIGEQGTFWITNNIIWGILLAPAIALAEVVKRDVSYSSKCIVTNTRYYILAIIIFSILWLGSIPFWESMLSKVLKINNPTVIHLMTIQTVFYIVFMFNNSILDATLAGLGLTKYLLVQSIIVNIGYYSIVYFLYRQGYLEMSLDNIAYIFGGGMIVDVIPSIWLYIKAIQKHHINVNQLLFR